MTDYEQNRLIALRGALARSTMQDPVIRQGAAVDVTLTMSRETWALLAWAVSDSPETAQ